MATSIILIKAERNRINEVAGKLTETEGIFTPHTRCMATTEAGRNPRYR